MKLIVHRSVRVLSYYESCHRVVCIPTYNRFDLQMDSGGCAYKDIRAHEEDELNSIHDCRVYLTSLIATSFPMLYCLRMWREAASSKSVPFL